jgi:taurine transport system permease protein
MSVTRGPHADHLARPYGSAFARPVRRSWLTHRLDRDRPLGRVVCFCGVFVLLFVLWMALAPFFPSYMLPSPASVFGAIGLNFQMGILPTFIAESVRHLLIAGLVGILIGIPMGLLIGFVRPVAAFFYPLLNFLQALSGIAWLPMIIVWFGFTENALLAVVDYTALFPVIFSTMTGVQTIPRIYGNAVRTLGGNRWTIIRDVLLPGALPNIVTGVRLGTAYSWRALIAGEMLIGANGLGFMIFNAGAQGQTQEIVAGMLIIGTLWLLLDQLFLRPFEVITIERWGLVGR